MGFVWNICVRQNLHGFYHSPIHIAISWAYISHFQTVTSPFWLLRSPSFRQNLQQSPFSAGKIMVFLQTFPEIDPFYFLANPDSCSLQCCTFCAGPVPASSRLWQSWTTKNTATTCEPPRRCDAAMVHHGAVKIHTHSSRGWTVKDPIVQ